MIDVWDTDTFDVELRSYLAEHADLIRKFWAESRRLFMERERQTVRGYHEQNVFGPAHSRLYANVEIMMSERIVRAWHYTRLTDAEVAGIRTGGMHPMSLDLIRRRLDLMIEGGNLTPEIATSCTMRALSRADRRQP